MPTFFIRKGKTKISVKADEILYFQADGKYTVIATKYGEQYMASKCLSCFEEFLPADVFFRVHRKYLVNSRHVREFFENHACFVRLNNGECIPVSARRKPEVSRFIKKNTI